MRLTRVNISVLVALLVLLNPLVLFADPVTAFFATWYGALALSAALSAASVGLNYLFRPKIKPAEKARPQDIQLSNVGEDIVINEIYGKRQADGLGGIRTGLTCVYASPIRKVTVTVPGGGGGKGFAKAAPNTEDHYYQDFALLAGAGPLRVLDLMANTDVLYQDFNVDDVPNGTLMEAENSTIAGGTVISDSSMSNGHGVKRTNFLGMTLTFTGITALSGEILDRKLYISYKSSAGDGAFDAAISIAVNGGAQQLYTLPDSGGLVSNIMVVVSLSVGSNTIVITTAEIAPAIDCIHIANPVFVPPDCDPDVDPRCQGCFISGIQDPSYTSPNASFGNDTLVVSGTLPNPCLQYNYQPPLSTNGMIEATTANAVQIRIYEGNYTQTADPMLQTYFEGKYGAGATPAYRGRCLIVLENFETTKYGAAMPNWTALLQHQTAGTLKAMYDIRAAKAGLQSSEYDFSAFSGIPLRGYAITQQQSPSTEIKILDRIFDVDIIQNNSGVVQGVVPDYSIERTIPITELDVVEMNGSSPVDTTSTPPVPVERTVMPDESIPSFFDVSFFDASRPGTTSNVHAVRQTTAASGKANIQTGLVMLQVEAQQFGTRDLQKQWAQKDALKISTLWKHAKVTPATVIKCEELDGGFSQMYVKGVQGLIPSVYEITGVSHEQDELAPRANETPIVSTLAQRQEQLARFVPPAVVVGTIIDLMQFRSENNTPGIYVAACVYDSHYIWRGATLAWERETGYEFLASIDKQATMGQTTGALAAVPGGWTPGAWDDTNPIQITLKYGELESLTDAEVLDRNNVMVIGNEVIAFGTATLNSSVTNTWTLTHLQRHLDGDLTVTHATHERAVLMNTAVKFVPLDDSEIGQTRNFVFTAGGQAVADSLKTSYTFDGASTLETAGAPAGQIFYFNDDRTSTAAGSDLYSIRIPANTLSTNGDRIKARFYIKFAANGNSKFTYINWNATALWSDELTDNATRGWFDVDIIRASATSLETETALIFSGASEPEIVNTVLTGLDLTVDNYLALNCTSDADGDLIATAANASYEPAPAIVVPSTITIPSLWGMYEADSYSQSDGSNITTQWTDKSGLGHHGTVNGTPTFETNELNGQPIVRFGADSNDYFQFASMAAFTHGAIVKVMKVTTETNGGDLFGTSGSGSTYPFTTDHEIYDGFGSNTRKDSIVAPSSLASWHVVYKYSAASKWGIEINGTQAFKTATNTVAFSSTPRIGTNGSAYEKADYAAVYVFNAIPTVGQINDLLRYIKSKYNV